MENTIVADKLNRILKEKGAHYEVIPHAEAFTAPETAEAEHISGKKVAKVVMLKADGRNVMAVIPANTTLDENKVKKILASSELRLASEHEFQDLFYGCETGAMPPFGHLYGIPLYVDRALAEKDDIVFNGGTHRAAVRMPFQEYQKLAKPRVCELTKSGWKALWKDKDARKSRPDRNRDIYPQTGEEDSHFVQK